MQFAALASLALSAAGVSALAVQERAGSEVTFSVYQSSGCSLHPPLDYSEKAGTVCVPAPEYDMLSVLVKSVGPNCTVGFFSSFNDCSSVVADTSSEISVGACYTFPPNKTPHQFGITCPDA